jgi:hypothetical protein
VSVARRLVGLAAVGAVVAGCGDDDEEVEPAGPITVEQLVARSSDTPIEVEGFLLAEGTLVRLCAAILESYPPQCGEPSVELVGLDLGEVPGTTAEGDVVWLEGAMLRVEREGDGRFAVLGVTG